MNISIEDNFEDIITKMMRGRHVTEGELSAKTGVPRDVLSRLCRGEFCDEDALKKVARALDLDVDALTVAASNAWRPRAISMDGLAILLLLVLWEQRFGLMTKLIIPAYTIR